MLHPTIDELNKNDMNRYELALATAKCARMITDEYVAQREAAEKSLTGNKETDRPIQSMIDRELRDEKAVQVALNRIYNGEYEIDLCRGGEVTADPSENASDADEFAE